jgi:hypothetical protein
MFLKLTFTIKGLFVALSIRTLCHCTERLYAECHVSFIVMLNVIMLSVVVPMQAIVILR